ncbi:MAG: hypothetical protein JO199_05205, partial [Candidatus Eremiobacteraeota bacterium]|nr:hypothetical protein [Candidatus Eremiobacteraeota bacterium]
QEFNPPYTSSPSAQIGNGIDTPQGVAFDTSDDLFVANSGNNTVTEYSVPIASGAAPAATISDHIKNPTGLMAVNNSGTLFVVNVPSNDETVTLYTGSAPTFTKSGGLSPGSDVAGMVTDPAGDLFIANGNSQSVEQYTSFSYASTPALSLPLPFAQDIAIDSNGTIFAVGSNTMIESASPYSTSTSYTTGFAAADTVALSP